MSVKEVLEQFGRRVKQQSKTNLTKLDKKVSGNLYDSIDYEVQQHKNSFTFKFVWEDYGAFVDKGVKGKLDGSKAPNSPFKYTNSMPPTKAFDKWIVKRGFAPRQNGKFKSRESMKFAIAKNIFNYGIKTTNFFSSPFENEFKKLPNEVVQAYGLELESFLQYTFAK